MDPNDRLAIEDLFWGYAYGYDTRDWSLYRAIWAPDGELVLANGTTFVGVDAIEAHARGRREDLAAKGIQTRHHQTGSRFEGRRPGRRPGAHDAAGRLAAPGRASAGAHAHRRVPRRRGAPAGRLRLRRRRIVIDHY
jgi:hypothetical protein